MIQEAKLIDLKIKYIINNANRKQNSNKHNIQIQYQTAFMINL